MVSTPVLFDTNILIDYLRGIPQARAECGRTFGPRGQHHQLDGSDGRLNRCQ
jgi:hypothetical protein